MKRNTTSCLLRLAAAGLAILMTLSVPPVLPVFAEEGECAESPFIFDFSSVDAVDGCTGLYNVSTLPDDGAMTIRFHNTGNDSCSDPYFNLPLPQNADVEEYHWFAMLVRTDKHDLRGELRFLTASTGLYNGGDYPCRFFNYRNTDDWQLIVFDLTERGALNYIRQTTPLTGNLLNLRLDPFNNDCPADTVYQIKAYALFSSREDAESFAYFKSRAQKEQEAASGVDYDSFWRGRAFETPALPTRLRWVSYGFADTSPVDKFLRQGYGGIVSNVNFTPTYLRDDAEFDTLAEVYEYAASKGMATWIYDEYQWPSGKAFGLVLEGHDEFEATGVEHHRLTGRGGQAVYEAGPCDIRILRADLTDEDGTRTLGSPSLPLSADASGSWTLDVYVLRRTFDGVENRADFTSLRDVDLLNPDAVAHFIEVTHERYKEKMGDAFGLVEAFFTDEPQLGNRAMTGYCVWTPGLEDRFRETYGYELNLPSLFSGDTEADRVCRMNYYRLVASLFRTSYFEQISAWCAANGTKSSGHLLFEEKMNDQIETYGGDFLQVVGAMDIPGVDLLWVAPEKLLSDCYIGSFMGMRYVTSAAKNAGKTQVMVEFNPDASGTLSETDPLGECIGGASVTRLMGTTIYNVINPQMNLTNAQLNTLNTYVGRLNTLLDGSVETGKAAVFYPVATVQAYHNADTGHGSETVNGARTSANQIDVKYQSLCKSLITDRVLYTVLDDETLRAATVASDGCLCAGNGAYTLLIVPYAEYMSLDALQTLVTFREAGGHILFLGDTPVHGLNPGEDEAAAALMAQLADCPRFTSVRTIMDSVHEYAPTDMAVTGDKTAMGGLLYGDFETNDRDLTYLTNTGARDAAYTLTYTDGYDGKVTVYRPLTGLIEAASVGGGLSLTIRSGEAVIIVREDVNDHRAQHTPFVPEEETQPESGTEPAPDTEPDPVTEPDAGSDTQAVSADESTEAAPGTDDAPGAETGCRSLLAPGCLPGLLAAAYVMKKKRRG